MGTSNLSGKPDEMLRGEGTCDGLASHPGGVAILLRAKWPITAPAVMGHLARKTLPNSHLHEVFSNTGIAGDRSLISA